LIGRGTAAASTSDEETVVTFAAPTHHDLSQVHERLTAVIADVIAPSAAEVDRTGTFPRAAIDALARAGVLGAASATEVGGGGGGSPMSPRSWSRSLGRARPRRWSC
jgi:alkylation response protein AidB-like acyl-CoA dehydrogenase